MFGGPADGTRLAIPVQNCVKSQREQKPRFQVLLQLILSRVHQLSVVLAVTQVSTRFSVTKSLPLRKTLSLCYVNPSGQSSSDGTLTTF